MSVKPVHTIQLLILAIVGIICSCYVHAQTTPSTPQVCADLSVKLASFEKNISEKGKDLTIYVFNAPAVAKELKKSIGTQIGKSKIVAVIEGTALPVNKPDIIFIGNTQQALKAVKYARTNSVLSVCNDVEIANLGATVCIAQSDSENKPYVSISANASHEENLEWNPAIFKWVRSTR
ncbi:MAG: YfiR/HmsC family protein [Candidatus Kapaibacterium sp.]|nr:YfiR/HmsC family protein [Bacteroidota bacterium]